MAINKNVVNEFNIKTETITVNKNGWTKILTKTGIDRHFVLISVASTAEDFIHLSIKKDGSDSISLDSLLMMINEFQFYNGDLYAKVDNSSVAETINVIVWQNENQ